MDDLWHLQQILEIGDKVTSKTERRITIKRGSEIVKGEREIITLTISVEKINLDGQLRLTGKIVEGPGVYFCTRIHPAAMHGNN